MLPAMPLSRFNRAIESSYERIDSLNRRHEVGFFHASHLLPDSLVGAFQDNGRLLGRDFPMSLQSLDEFDYFQRLSAQRGVALVLFSSPTCGTCRQVELMLPNAVSDDVATYKVDVQQNPGLGQAFEIFHLPSLFMYWQGRYHAKLDCEVSPAALESAIQNALANPPEEEP